MNDTISAEAVPTTDRATNGRFTKGNRGGPGNPFARQTAALRAYLISTSVSSDLFGHEERVRPSGESEGVDSPLDHRANYTKAAIAKVANDKILMDRIRKETCRHIGCAARP